MTEGKASLETGMKCARKVRKESDVLKEFITTTEKLVVQQARPDSRLPPEQMLPLLEVATRYYQRLSCTGRMRHNVEVFVYMYMSILR